MKTKIVIYCSVALLAIISINLFLWQHDAKEINMTDNSIEAPQSEIQIDVQGSNNFEYPAPVKQLQQVLAKSYQPPVFEGEEIFPEDLLPLDGKASVKSEMQADIDQLRKRMESLK
ncbi:hypothetical protein C9J03_00980 [Photobacterium gaetbulicola]|uniref:Uncharacterized protein n=1 Tax=Photobacterium gaetbulicola Gung47 TaxID=658445 RepID=A0A0C5WF12_9GAMM|nr:hypothetical protein [Photobacterium gaetbulicola]AJR05713.1 hypothetical protein H744_1c0688 [Photobacterium gaetbulicola Gung47]PSU14683.1 hypothetical protein C9J03_00980 [Photobacterium gaetbulicola]